MIAGASEGTSQIYDTNRVGGSFSYSFSAADGLLPDHAYTVTLHFADLYWGKPGQRIFSVSANGVTVLKDYDVVAAAGADGQISRNILEILDTRSFR